MLYVCPNRTGLYQFAPEHTGPVRTGPDWSGVDRTRLVRTGPDQSGPVQTSAVQTGPVRCGSGRARVRAGMGESQKPFTIIVLIGRWLR